MKKENIAEYEHPTYALSNEEAHRQTVEGIEAALLLLLRDKALPEISVTELARKAGVSRAAFYRNYASPEAVLEEIVLRHARNTCQACLQTRSGETGNYWLGMFSYAYDHPDFYTLIVSRKAAGYISQYTDYIAQQIFTQPKMDNPYFLSFTRGAVTGIFTDWLKNGMVESPEEMAALVQTALDNRLPEFLSGNASIGAMSST